MTFDRFAVLAHRVVNAVRSSWKSSTAAVSFTLAWAQLVVASPTPGVTAEEWIGLAFGLAGAAGVYVVTNAPKT